MRAEYSSEDLLPLSGIQHFVFCRRQWALMYVERQWQDNLLTVEGKLLHTRVDDPYFTEVRNGVIITRSMPVASYRLGLSGICDVVEFTPSAEGVNLHGRTGSYLPAAVEYKRGKEKAGPCDEAQLCAQTLCLEEMLSVHIPRGYFYYGEIRHRIEVEIGSELRSLVVDMAAEMHAYFERGYTPQVKPSKACKSCSLEDVCVPALLEKVIPASKYVRMHVEGEQ